MSQAREKLNMMRDLRSLKENTAFRRSIVNANKKAIAYLEDVLLHHDPTDQIGIAQTQREISVRRAMDFDYENCDMIASKLQEELKTKPKPQSDLVPPEGD